MTKLSGAALALTLLLGSTAPQALAAPPQHRRAVAHARHAATHARHVARHDRNVARHDRRVVRHDRGVVRHDRRVAHAWRTGQRLPRAYFGPRYYVNDWRTYRLPPPRPGYRWVRRDDDFLLVAATTGLIASVIAATR